MCFCPGSLTVCALHRKTPGYDPVKMRSFSETDEERRELRCKHVFCDLFIYNLLLERPGLGDSSVSVGQQFNVKIQG